MLHKCKLVGIMKGNKQNQKAGNNSQQIQAESITVVNVGIDEKRAREICQEMNLQLRMEYTDEALAIAKSRVAEFENRLLPKMEAVDGALEVFADPSFQLLLAEAQKTAASSERPADYDLLSELLIHRFQKGENRIIRAGIRRAVEIVDEIADEALLGLTVFHSASYFIPTSGDVNVGLDVLNNLFAKIIYGELPTGNNWLDHLDILDAVRVNSYARLKKTEEYYPELLGGYVEVGIEKESENYSKAIEILHINKLPQNILVEHALNSNFVRFDLFGKGQIDSLVLDSRMSNGNVISVPLSENQKNAIISIYDLYKKDDVLKKQNVNAFMEEWDKRPYLKILRQWWDNINVNIQITSVGRVLAHSNAQRCDKNLPPLD